MWRSLFLAMLLQAFSFTLLAQQGEPDSVRALVEQTVRAWRDSLKEQQALEQIKSKSKPLDRFLAEVRAEKQKEERRRWIRLGALAIFIFALFAAIARRYTQQRRLRKQ